MAMTAMVKDELSRVECTKTSERKAEVTALLRFSGGLHIVGGRVVIEAELDTGSVARRLRRDISEVYGYTSGVSVLAGGNIRRGVRYLVRIAKHGEGLARQTGLVDQRGRPVRGLPPSVVSGGINDAEAAWRGAFLAHGSLTEPGRSSSLEVTCPGPEAAMALVGAARRLGIAAKAREVRGADRVVVRDGDAISALLTRMGAHDAVLAWEERRMRREVRATANRLANFDDANLRRSARAAVAAGATGCTDVTGFGLLGHLMKMVVASRVDAVLDVAAVPVLPGVRALAESGVLPGGSRRNRDWVASSVDTGGYGEIDVLLLADAQTSGGLLFGAEPERAREAVESLAADGVSAAVIGEVRVGTGRITLR